MHLHEETISSEVVYDGALLHIRRDTVRLGEDGRESVREWAFHPGASAVVPLFSNGDTMLVRQYRHPARQEFLEVPAGKFDGPHETALDVARRELVEEVGLTAQRWTPLGATHPCIGYSNEVIHLFLAEGLTEGAARPDDGEQMIPVRMPLTEAVAMALDGHIADAKSFVALVLADAELTRRRRP